MIQRSQMTLITSSFCMLSVLHGSVASSAEIKDVNHPVSSVFSSKVLMHSSENRIPDHYIVKLKSEVNARAVDTVISRSVDSKNVKYRYQNVFKGFSAQLSQEELDKLVADEEVEFIEEDSIMKATQIQTNPPSWGLDRINQPDLSLDKKYSYTQSGRGVNVYVIDTGIKLSHSEFEGRAVSAFTTINDGKGSEDCDGHGTHVAATIGGKTYGVAKNVKLNAVRVLDCSGSGSTSGVIAGIDWVQDNHVGPSVINMSLGGGASASMDAAVKGATQAGVTVVVAAGNDGRDACSDSPGRAPEAITVGATASTDDRAFFSNYGKCVDIFAPGEKITSAWIGSETATNTISGTSMASPHVAGVAALYLESVPQADPNQVAQALKSAAVYGRVKTAGTGSPNLLLQSAVAEPFENLCLASNCKAFTGSLNQNYYVYNPNGSYYYAQKGVQEIWLRATPGTDFDVELLQWTGSAWKVVAQGIGPTSNEHLIYNGTAAAYYTVRVSSATGNGKYSLWVKY